MAPEDRYPAPRWKVVLVVCLCLTALLILLLSGGCATQPSEPYVTVTDQWVEYNPVPKNGVYGKTKGGAILVTVERFLWPEDLAIENEELKLKLEQERLSKLKNP